MDKLDEYLDVAIELAKKAGAMIIESHRDGEFKIGTKTSVRDLVTEIDLKIERFIFDSLKQRYPDHRFIGEESAANSSDDNSEKLTTDEPTWIVDPIDGTMNFAHFSPWCSVSIGLAINQKLVLGVIDCPHLNRTYSAKINGGAFCNGQPIHVSSADDVEKSLVQTDLPISLPESSKHHKTFRNIFDNIYWKCQGYRRVGSCCVSLCLLAEGSADVYFMKGIKIWDMAAGYVIVTEAGGYVCDLHGNDFDPNNGSLLAASNKILASKISNLISDSKR